MKKFIVWNYKANIQSIRRYETAMKSIATDIVITDNLTTFTLYSKISYEELVNKLVKEKYSDSEEFAILRKAINGITDEYETYNAYVEYCKARAKEFIAERDVIVNG